MSTESSPRRPDRYLIDQLLEERPLTRVWTATDRRLDRDVRFEEMRPDRDDGGESRFAFQRDLRRMARLDHPSFAPIYDVHEGDDQQPPYAVFGSNPKRSFRDAVVEHFRPRTSTKRLDPAVERADLIAAFLTVAQGVSFAHERGLVHGGLASSRIGSGDHGEVVLPRHGWSDEAPSQPSMRPESAAPSIVDMRTARQRDVDALAEVLAEALSGEAPASDLRVRWRFRDQGGWAALVRRARARRPADRFQSAAEIVDEVMRIAADLDPRTTRLGFQTRLTRLIRRQAALAAVVVGLLAVLLVRAEVRLDAIARDREAVEQRAVILQGSLSAESNRTEFLETSLEDSIGRSSPEAAAPLRPVELHDFLVRQSLDYGALVDDQANQSSDTRSRLGELYGRLAHEAKVAGRDAEAESALRRAVELFDALQRVERGRTFYQRRLAASLTELADQRIEQGRTREARAALYRARPIVDEIIGRLDGEPDGGSGRFSGSSSIGGSLFRLRARILLGLGICHHDEAAYDLAEQNEQFALQALERAASLEPSPRSDARLRSRLARVRAETLRRIGHEAEARTLLDPICDRSILGPATAEAPEERHERALALLARARISGGYAEHTGRAQRDLERAADLLREVSAAQPRRTRPRIDLAAVEVEGGRVDQPGRGAVFARVLSDLRRLIAASPRDVAARRVLVAGLDQLGSARLRSGDPAGARPYFAEALAQAEVIVATDPIGTADAETNDRLRGQLRRLRD